MLRLSLESLAPTLAHGGHGHTDGHTLLHWIVEPSHLPFFVAAVCAVAAGALFVARRRARR